jgi:succinyl-diaminopimelate desuccinylase
VAIPVRFDDAIAFASDLIRIPSPPGGEEQVARRVAQEMRALDFADVRTDGVGNVIGVVRGAGGGPSIMLSSHLDVVAEGDVSSWEHPPFSGVVAGGFLHGRGAMDIKGPLAIQTYAAAALAGRAKGDIIVAHTVYEERGGLGMRSLMEAGEVKPDAVIIGEATNGAICLGHRGRAELEVEILGKAGHASAPERALNPIDALPAVLHALRALATDQPSHPLLGKSTIAVTDLVAVPESRNVIPDRVSVILDWRILPEQTLESLLARVRSALDTPEVAEARRAGFEVGVKPAQETQRTYTGVVRERQMFTPGFITEPEHPLVKAAVRTVGRREGGGDAEVRPWTFATDGGWTCGVFKIPTLGFAPGEERFAHTNRERLDLAEARWSLERYPELILAMQETLASA